VDDGGFIMAGRSEYDLNGLYNHFFAIYQIAKIQLTITYILLNYYQDEDDCSANA